jgi:SAM-dependent methyltransferase
VRHLEQIYQKKKDKIKTVKDLFLYDVEQSEILIPDRWNSDTPELSKKAYKKELENNRHKYVDTFSPLLILERLNNDNMLSQSTLNGVKNLDYSDDHRFGCNPVHYTTLDIASTEDVLQVFSDTMSQDAENYLESKKREIAEMRANLQIAYHDDYFETFGSKRKQAEQAFRQIWEQKAYGERIAESKENFKDKSIKVSNSENYGEQVNEPNKLTKAFVDFAAQQARSRNGKSIVDIGCGFGVNTLRALEKGSNVIALDLEPRNLAVLLALVPKKQLKRLHISLAAFPKDSDDLVDDSASAVLLSHVAHYFTPSEEEEALQKIYKLLQPGGKLFLQSLTPNAGPYLGFPEGARAKAALKAAKKKARSDSPEFVPWPSYLGENEFAPHPQHRFVLKKYLTDIGFDVEEAAHFYFADNLPWDEKSHKQHGKKANQVVGVIAKKPSE